MKQRLPAFLLLVALFACDRAHDSLRVDSPELVLVDSAVLQEPIDAPIGIARGFAVASDGRLVVSDQQEGRLLVFDAAGRIAQVIGRRGNGPGEWANGPFTLHTFGDAQLLASDGSSLRAIALADGRTLWQRSRSPLEQAVGTAGEFVLTRGIDRARRASLQRFRSGADSIEFGGPFPAPLGRSQAVDFGLVFPAAGEYSADTIAIVVTGSDHLFLGPFGGPFDSIPFPVRTRRGAQRDLLDAVDDADQESMMRAAYRASHPFGVVALPERGHVAIITFDQTFVDNRMTGQLHLSVIDVPGRRACVDAPVPAATDPFGWTDIRGDTLVVFSQEVDRAASNSAAVVRRFLIDTRHCAWREAATPRAR